MHTKFLCIIVNMLVPGWYQL